MTARLRFTRAELKTIAVIATEQACEVEVEIPGPDGITARARPQREKDDRDKEKRVERIKL